MTDKEIKERFLKDAGWNQYYHDNYWVHKKTLLHRKEPGLTERRGKMKFDCKKPCSNCPYRKDAPKKLWDKQEFIDLMANDSNTFGGKMYGCHKKNGNACAGWMINQLDRGTPSIQLRMALIKAGLTREELDKFKSAKPMYKSIEEMSFANYPELKRR
jgi:hypothetical protein